MTTQKLFKRRVRARMAKTGESYTTARTHVAARRERAVEPLDLSAAFELASDAKVRQATGQGWEAWIGILDRWGARERKHPEIAEYLIAQHDVPGWYAQAITNGYERVRGMRIKHQQPTGFTIYASRTVAVPLETLFRAFMDDATRGAWLRDGTMSPRSSQPGKTARFDWADGASRILVTFEEKRPSRSTAYVAHERLSNATEAETAKTAWKQRLAALKAFLEATDA
jgi:uncharacterized protein YndB with AHSA1/START domain